MCTVDAGIPHEQGVPANLKGRNSIDMTFDDSCNVASMAPADFSVACTPAGAPCPTVTQVNDAGQVVTVTLSTPIPAQKWTCVTHTASGDQVCVGSMPGDANGNQATLPSDILDIIDTVNNVRIPLLPLHLCDIDRSGVCLPADIITEIDLLNGLGFPPAPGWNGKSLPALGACPP